MTMESPSRALTLSPQLLHQCSIRRPSSNETTSNSPEFEFWNIGHYPQPSSPLHSADYLFSDGFLLPLHSLPPHHSEPEPGPEFITEPTSSIEPSVPGHLYEPNAHSESDLEPGSCSRLVEPSPLIISQVSSNNNPILSASKRWKEIFKRGEKKPLANTNNDASQETKLEKPEKMREKGKKKSNGSVGSNSTELNINIWPFSRSRSAGTNSGRSKAASNRKVSSAPCSRSNSSGESKSSRRSWPSSPGRAGVHLGRASPVWHIKRNGPGSRASVNGGSSGGGTKGRVLKLNVPVCIGYRQPLSCQSDENGGATGVGSGGVGAKSGGVSGSNGNLFGLRGLFSKKSSVLTV